MRVKFIKVSKNREATPRNCSCWTSYWLDYVFDASPV